jgi:hypothetical protein
MAAFVPDGLHCVWHATRGHARQDRARSARSNGPPIWLFAEPARIGYLSSLLHP